MKINSVLITGASGFIGKALVNYLRNQGLTVHALVRKFPKVRAEGVKYFKWNPERNELDLKAFEDVEAIVHLAGAPVIDKAWTNKRKKELFESRIQSMQFLWDQCPDKSQIKRVVSASGIAFYGTCTQNKAVVESSGVVHQDFLQHLTVAWEEVITELKVPHFNQIRTPLVLHPDGGFLKKIKPIVSVGFASSLGSGKQWVSWIHLHDLLKIYFMAIQGAYPNGPVNAVSADNRSFKDFMKSICDHYGKVILPISVPAFLLQLVLGQRSKLITKGLPVRSEIISDADLQYPILENALKSFPNK